MFKKIRKNLRPGYSILAAGIAVLFAVIPGLEQSTSHAAMYAATVEPQQAVEVSHAEQAEVIDETDEPVEASSEEESSAPSPSARNITPLALDMRDCSYADPGTGAYAETLCWIDFTGFTTQYRNDGWIIPNWVSALDPEGGPYVHTVSNSSANAGGSRWGHVQNVDVEVDLGDGFVLRAQLDTDSAGANSARAISAHGFPTWGGAFLGSTTGGAFYTGVQGQPALYQALDGGGTSTVTLKNIRLERDGQRLQDYSIVVADAETTDAGEGIQWTTTGAGFRWLPNTPPGNTKAQMMGNACTSTTPAWDSTTPVQNASCTANTSSTKNGTPMLATEPPANANTSFQISQTLSGGGRQGVAFGIIMARASVEASVADRIVDASNTENDPTNFTATVEQAFDSSLLMTAETGSHEKTSGAVSNVLPVSSTGTRIRYGTTATGGAVSSYTPAWQCAKDDPTTGTTTYWPSETTTSPTPLPSSHDFSLVKVGEFLRCSVEYVPPYLSLIKSVDNGDTAATNTAADFTLHAEGSGASSSAISGAGNAAAQVTKRPVAVGQYELGEIAPDMADTTNWLYGYDWTDVQCVPNQGSGTVDPDAFDVARDHLGNVTQASLEILAGHDVTCTFVNMAREPQITTLKEAFDASDEVLDWAEPVAAGDTVRYKLTFTNSGTAPLELDQVDYLADVLDDANYVAGSLRIQNGQESGYPASNMASSGIAVVEEVDGENPRLEITGTIDRGDTRTVWFEVTVLDNAENAPERQQDSSRSGDDRPHQVGYALNNYLVPAGEPVPDTCEEPTDPAQATCTHQPVPAWSLDKSSRPADGARLHKGGNTHYQITATKMNTATDIDQLVFTDDLTHVFKTAGWAPNAAVPGGAKPRGIYFLDADGQTLDANGNVTAEQPAAAYDADSGVVPEPTFDAATERWTLTTLPVDVPAAAQEAELWFAVEAGQTPVGIPAQWTAPNSPQMGWRYTNYVTAQAASLAPNQCDTTSVGVPDTGIAPNATPAFDADFPEACRVTHQLSENYFTIRKDASGAGVHPTPTDSTWGDSTGLTNMVGHEFEIRDDLNGAPSDYPSQKLCRTEYHPDQGWDGTFISGGTPDWGENSETLAAIIAHNNLQTDEADHLPLCALFYPQGTYGGQPHAGGQDGRWRSEQLGEGDYWLVETKAPTQQINTTGTQSREATGVQLLAEPVGFRVWPDEPAPTFGDTGQAMHGQGQLDIAGEEERCSPGADVGDRPVACVNPTGYLMIVKDAAPLSLPLTGGQWLGLLSGVGGVILVGSLAIAWWRKRNPKLLSARGGTAGEQ